MAEIELKRLITQRGVIKGQLSRFATYLNNFVADSDSIIELQARLDTILGVLDSFNSVQGEIECIDQDPQSQQTHASERDAFESKYFRQIAQARRLLTATPSPLSEQGTDPVSNASNSSKIEVKLPQIHLPEFSGAYDKWTQYKETFEALISKNQSLSKVQKFYYLLY